MKQKTISIISGPDCDLEAMALRNSLEYLGFIVILRAVGRPDDLINILKNDKLTKSSEILIFCFHGKNKKFIMPELSREIYRPDEPRTDFGFKEIEKYANLSGQHIIVTGCTLGNQKIADSFLRSKAKTFIGSAGYPQANSALIFVTTLFYYLSKNESYDEVFKKAANIDDETKQFRFYKP